MLTDVHGITTPLQREKKGGLVSCGELRNSGEGTCKKDLNLMRSFL